MNTIIVAASRSFFKYQGFSDWSLIKLINYGYSNMVVDLNTASRDTLLGAGLTASEVQRIKKFRTDNAVFHTKEELKEHCGFSRARYEQIEDQLTAHRLQRSEYSQEVKTRKYRRDNNVRDDWDVGHIIAHANDGADHPANYIPMARGYNRKLRHLHDGVIFAHLKEDRVREAVRASRVQTQCSLTFDEALQKKHDALNNCQELKLFKEGRGRVAEDSGVESREVAHAVCGTEACLCDPEYCERLIREWIELYGS